MAGEGKKGVCDREIGERNEQGDWGEGLEEMKREVREMEWSRENVRLWI